MTALRFGGNIFGNLVFVMSMAASAVQAAPTEPAGESPAVPTQGSLETTTSGEGKSAWQNLGVGLFGWTKGNGVGRWDGRQAKEDGTPGDPVEITNQISVTYPTNIGMDFIVMPQFKARPLLTTQDKERFELLNPTVGIVGTVMQRGGFSWWARFDNELPLTASSRRDGLVLSPGSVNSIAYRFANSGWELQSVIVPSFGIFANGDAKSFLYFSPRVNYIIDPSWTVFGIMEAATETKRATGLDNFVAAQATNIGAGFKYSFSDLYLQPYVNVYPFNKVNDTTTYIGMMFGGRLK